MWFRAWDLNEILHAKRQTVGRFYNHHHGYLGDLMDAIGNVGYKFTWRNKCRGLNIIRKRLDRVICGAEWLSVIPYVYFEHKPFLVSNHCPLIINLSKNNEFLPKPFRFEAWPREPSCKTVINKAWRHNVRGSTYSLKLC